MSRMYADDDFADDVEVKSVELLAWEAQMRETTEALGVPVDPEQDS